MANVSIPSFFADTTGGVLSAEARGGTVGEVLDSLDAEFPGMKARVCDDGKLKTFIVITVDGRVAADDLSTPVRPESDIGILFAMGGG